MTIAKSVRDSLAGDTIITNLVDTYAARPAVFEGDATPDNYTLGDKGFVLIGSPLGSQNEDTTDAYRSREAYRIRVYAPDGRERAQKLGEAVKAALHDKPLTVAGLEISGMTATRPVTAPTSEPSVEGRTVNLTIFIKEL